MATATMHAKLLLFISTALFFSLPHLIHHFQSPAPHHPRMTAPLKPHFHFRGNGGDTDKSDMLPDGDGRELVAEGDAALPPHQRRHWRVVHRRPDGAAISDLEEGEEEEEALAVDANVQSDGSDNNSNNHARGGGGEAHGRGRWQRREGARHHPHHRKPHQRDGSDVATAHSESASLSRAGHRTVSHGHFSPNRASPPPLPPHGRRCAALMLVVLPAALVAAAGIAASVAESRRAATAFLIVLAIATSASVAGTAVRATLVQQRCSAIREDQASCPRFEEEPVNTLTAATDSQPLPRRLGGGDHHQRHLPRDPFHMPQPDPSFNRHHHHHHHDPECGHRVGGQMLATVAAAGLFALVGASLRRALPSTAAAAFSKDPVYEGVPCGEPAVEEVEEVVV